MSRKQPKPFLKWAGGKTQLLTAIASRIPYERDDNFVYIEPFVGSGAVLFWILNNYPNLKKAVINDMNIDLVNTYKAVSESVEDIISLLEVWENEYHLLSADEEKKKEYYYSKRELFNTRKSEMACQASLLVFLNKTCFNGLYRVSKKNSFNVPIGSYKKPSICDAENLRAVSRVLQKVTILEGDFEHTVDYAEKQTCFYLDPPYKPVSKTSSFNSYAMHSFDDSEQVRLKEFCSRLNASGHSWILSNSDVKGRQAEDNFFDEIYGEFQIDRVLAKRRINSNAAKRGELTELLITNY